jgi:pentatricopeptide repeat protein
MEVYRDILESAPFSSSSISYRHLTKGLVSAGRIGDALDLLHEMLNRGAGADSLVYNNLIAGYIDLGDWDKAFELFNEIAERALSMMVSSTPPSWRGTGSRERTRRPWKTTSPCLIGASR